MSFTVTISGGSAIEIYGGETAIDARLNAMIGDGPTAYRALSQGSDGRRRLMVAATWYVDAQGWQGTAELVGTTLQFPRSGITKGDGTVVDDATQLVAVVNAVCELVALLADDDSILGASDAGSNVRGIGAGSARVDFWRPTSYGDGNATILPVQVSRYIGKWLGIASAAVAAAGAGSASGGTSSCSDFEDTDNDGDSPVRNVFWPL